MPTRRRLALLTLLAACNQATIIEGTTEAGATTTATSESPPDTTSGSTSSPTDAPLPTTSGDPATGPPATCGDGMVDVGEQCDDGNTDDTDLCTSLCAPPACDDGIASGAETDVDCGGACEPCDAEARCIAPADCQSLACVAGACAPLLASCLALLTQYPDLPDEAYYIDPDGDGDPVIVYCDMQGGGWTEAAKDTLDDPIMGWSLGEHGGCGSLTNNMLGPLGMGDVTAKTFTLLGVPHTEARVRVEFIIMDSWDDNERVTVTLDGQQISEQMCTITNLPLCHQNDNLCGTGYEDGRIPVTGVRGHVEDAALVELRAFLDEPKSNESWGVDLVSVFVR